MINPTTDKVTEFTKPPGMAAGSHPQAITVGADGNLWFTGTPTSAVSPEAIGRFNGYDGYRWLLDGSPIPTATGTSYTPTDAEAGHQLACEATVTYTLFPTTVSATSAAVEVEGAGKQLSELAAVVVGVGPGKSLAGQTSAIRAAVAASYTADACDGLRAFTNEVNAQTGKKLGTRRQRHC